MTTREEIVATARTLIGTPYHHMGRVPGPNGAIDCAGVLICVGRILGLVAPDFDVPTYDPQPDGHTLLALCARFMGRPIVNAASLQPGDAVIVRTGKHPRHMGVVGNHLRYEGVLSLIHAASSELTGGLVIETRLEFSRSLAFVGGYTFPGIE